MSAWVVTIPEKVHIGGDHSCKSPDGWWPLLQTGGSPQIWTEGHMGVKKLKSDFMV